MKFLLTRIILLLGIAVTNINCQSIFHPKLFKNLTKEQTGIDFENKLTYSDSLSVLDFEYMFNGAKEKNVK